MTGANVVALVFDRSTPRGRPDPGAVLQARQPAGLGALPPAGHGVGAIPNRAICACDAPFGVSNTIVAR